jgi:hypothetical protein
MRGQELPGRKLLQTVWSPLTDTIDRRKIAAKFNNLELAVSGRRHNGNGGARS